MKARLLSLLGLAFLYGCTTTVEEEYLDYFYSNKLSPESKQFTYILYLGEEGRSMTDKQRAHLSTSPETGAGRKNQPVKRKSKNNKEDAYTSISFRMEEEAYKRLAILLKEKSFCSNPPSYEKSEYSWLRYTITGSCKS